MNVNELKTSRFLKQTDVREGMLCTITGVSQENIAADGAEENLKWCLHIAENEKPLVLNPTNGAILSKILGSDESDDWIGKKVVLYADPNISFGGKIVGGIRIRAPKTVARPSPVGKTKPAPVAAQTPVDDSPVGEPPAAADDLPF